MLATLRDPDLQRALDRDGFVVLRGLLSAADLHRLTTGFAELVRDDPRIPDDAGFDYEWAFSPDPAVPPTTLHFETEYVDSHVTFLAADAAYKRAAWALIAEVLDPRVLPLLDDHAPTPGAANFFHKPPGTGRIQIHQNWRMLDRHDATTVTVWAPLHAVTRENGGIQVVPGSHRLSWDIPALGTTPFWAGNEALLQTRYLVDVPLEAGDAILFEDSLIHHTSVNASDADRVAAQGNYRPASCPPRFFQRLPDRPDRFEVVELTEAFMLSLHASPGERVVARPIGWVEQRPERWTADELQRRLADPVGWRRELVERGGWEVVPYEPATR